MSTMMTCEDYLECLWDDGTLAPVIADQFWSGGCDTERLFEFMIESAKAEGVILSNMRHWDYDKALYECYKEDSDKALS